MAVYCTSVPGAVEVTGAETLMLLRVTLPTVTVKTALLLPKVAVTVAVPAPTAVTKPWLPAAVERLNTAVLELVHTAWVVRS